MLRQSTPDKEGALQVSKWLFSRGLLDGNELAQLIDALGDIHLYRVGTVIARGSEERTKQAFVVDYQAYLTAVKAGETPNEHNLTVAMTVDPAHLYEMPIASDRCLVRAIRPVIMVRPHCFTYSSIDRKFRSMVRGEGAIQWGLEFSYPQIFQDATSGNIEPIRQDAQFPNTIIFKTLQRWMRHNTLPTAFNVEGKRINVPIRVGKNCLAWAGDHPQLKHQGLGIYR